MVQARAEETRERIVNAATARFAQAGYDATGVAEICHSAGVSKGAFYHHFTSKQAVFQELLDRWLNRMDAQISASAVNSGNVTEQIQQMAALSHTIIETGSAQLLILLQFWTQASLNATISAISSHYLRRYHQVFVDILQRGVEEGSLRPMDTSLAAQAMLSLTMGLLLQGLLDPAGDEWGRVLRDSLETLLQGWRVE